MRRPAGGKNAAPPREHRTEGLKRTKICSLITPQDRGCQQCLKVRGLKSCTLLALT